MTKKLTIQTRPIIESVFTPACPVCQLPMLPIPGQKSGAWRCRNRTCRNNGGEYWDALDRRFKKLPLNSLNQDSPDQLTLMNQYQDFNPTCPRCISVPKNLSIPMLYMPDESWTCPECLGQYYPEGAPEVERVIDQKIKCQTKDIMKPGEGFKMQMSAKHKSSGGSKSGRKRSKPMKRDFAGRYYFSDDSGGNKGRKGA
jgi:hypothetical protein